MKISMQLINKNLTRLLSFISVKLDKMESNKIKYHLGELNDVGENALKDIKFFEAKKLKELKNDTIYINKKIDRTREFYQNAQLCLTLIFNFIHGVKHVKPKHDKCDKTNK